MEHDKIQRNLSAYKDGELDDDLRDQVSRHLQACDACREELRELDQIDSSVRGVSMTLFFNSSPKADWEFMILSNEENSSGEFFANLGEEAIFPRNQENS